MTEDRLSALFATARQRREAYLGRNGIEAGPDWDVLKFSEEAGEVAEAYQAAVDIGQSPQWTASAWENAVRELGGEVADCLGTLCLVALRHDVAPGDLMLPDGDAQQPERASTATSRLSIAAGHIVKLHLQLTAQTRSKDRPIEDMRADLVAALNDALAALALIAGRVGVSPRLEFMAKWGDFDRYPA